MKRRLTRFVLVSWNLVNSNVPKQCSTRCSWYVYLGTRVSCMCTYGVGYGVVVWNERQYQSLRKRNSKIAVPLLFMHINEAEHNPKVPLFSYVSTRSTPIIYRRWTENGPKTDRERLEKGVNKRSAKKYTIIKILAKHRVRWRFGVFSEAIRS